MRSYEGKTSVDGSRSATDGILARGLPASLVRWLTGLFFVIVLAADVLVFPIEEFACKRERFLAANWILLLGGAALVVVTLVVTTSDAGRSFAKRLLEYRETVDKAVVIVALVLLVVQIVAVHSYVFVPGWDAGRLVEDGWRLANNEGFRAGYYSRYPNNLLLLRLIQLCMKLALALGASHPIVGIFIFDILNCAACAIALLGIYYVLRQVASVGCALVGYALGVMLLWISPWASIIYSDAIVLAAPIVSMALVLAARRQAGWRSALLWLAFGANSIIGYRIKPQQIFPLFAVALLGVLSMTYMLKRENRDHRMSDLKRLGTSACAVVLGIALATSAANVITSRLSSRLNENAQFGWSHFLMMGLNPELRGVYAEEDVAYSAGFEDQAARTSANMERVRERLQQMGLGGTAHLLLDKLLTTYADGSFAWPVEGKFIAEEPRWHEDILSPLTLSLYYPGSESIPLGTRYEGWLTYEQAIWLLLLLLCPCSLLRRAGARASMEIDGERDDNRLYLETTLALTLLMLSAFELLFEARARYLYSFAALYVVLAALGIRYLYCLLRAHREAKSKAE